MLDRQAEKRSQFARIPRGQHGLAPELVSADQRARLNAAMVQVVAESGYDATTVEDVLSRAGVSRRTFYEHYENMQDCFVAACDEVFAQWLREGTVAYQMAAGNGEKGTVRARLRAGLEALFQLVLSDPLGARVLLIETLNCGRPGLCRLERAVAELEALLRRALGMRDARPPLPPAMVKAIVGGVLEIVTVRLRYGRTGELQELEEPLLEWMVSYRSPDAAAHVARARAQLTVSAPVATPDPQRATGNAAGAPGRLPLWRDESVRPISIREPRARIVTAAAQIASDRGYAALSINEIARVSGVSHHTFRKHFQTKQEAFVAAYREGSRATIEYSLQAYAAAPNWRAAVHAGLAAELRFLAERPALALIGFLEGYAAGSELHELRETELHLFTGALAPGYRETGRSVPPHAVVSEAIAGGIYQLMRECILNHGPERLPDLLPEVTYAALAPFTGAKAAASVAARPVSGLSAISQS